MESDLDDRNRERNAKISRNYGNTLVRALRERYGENFAAGLNGADTPGGISDAHSGLGDFGDRDGLNRAGGGPDVRSG